MKPPRIGPGRYQEHRQVRFQTPFQPLCKPWTIRRVAKDPSAPPRRKQRCKTVFCPSKWAGVEVKPELPVQFGIDPGRCRPMGSYRFEDNAALHAAIL